MGERLITNQLVSGSIPELLIKSSQYLLAFYFTQEGGYTVNIVDIYVNGMSEITCSFCLASIPDCVLETS